MKKYPLQLLVIVIERNKHKIIEKVFDEFSIVEKTNFLGHGTAATALGELFNFDIIDRDIVCTIIEEERLVKIHDRLDQVINFQEKGFALRFCVPINAISSDLITLLNLNIRGEK